MQKVHGFLKALALVAVLGFASCATTRPHPASGPKAYWANVRVQRSIHADDRIGVRVTVWILATAVNPTDYPVVIDCHKSLTVVPPHTEQDILTFPKDHCDLRNDTLYPGLGPIAPLTP